jgi:hypothetical protein
MIRNGAADFIGVVGLACASIFRWFEVVRLLPLGRPARPVIFPAPLNLQGELPSDERF